MIYNNQKGKNPVSINRWTAQQNLEPIYSGILFDYSVVKKNEGLLHATTRVELDDFLLGEIGQGQRTNVMFAFIWDTQNRTFS